ncbi:MAG TPA: carboxyl transferase domain-containing protein [Acidimicrobiales bacterium]|nr:carboxyl transferase domain-containing protein [Acidimicrobiales bacterium]
MGTAIASPLQGTVVSVAVALGDEVRAGQQVAVIESMKMEHVVVADHDGVVISIDAVVGATVVAGQPLLGVRRAELAPADHAPTAAAVPAERPDLAEVQERHAIGLDAARTEAVTRRHGTGHRTARENVADLCDEGSFVEYGALAIAAQRRRRDVDDLIRSTPADGLVGGIGTVDGRPVVALSYDYTVLAGTQGFQNHRKKDRLFELAERLRLPVVLFAEGGGGRPGDTDAPGVSGLDCMAFALFAELSALVPLVGIVAGRCFAGNAALLGCCDVIIATADANIGMGGPAMIEGGGLGTFAPEEIGPIEVQAPNGVVDVVVADEAEAVAVARRYLGYFTQDRGPWTAPDQELLRTVIPENRVRAYDIREVIAGLADDDSVLELRAGFGIGMVTALVRVEGRPLGVVANNPMHLGGAIDAPAADKAARFLQLCDGFDLPVLYLCDTPGFMVGPEAETTALVRHVSRMFVTGASLTVPFFTIVVRKGYGLGAQAMAGGSFKAPFFTVAWPTGEVGGMGLEGAVRLGFRKELEAITDPGERQRTFEAMVASMYERGKAVNSASHFEIDDVIDPADSRRWITAALSSAPPPPARTGKKRPMIDTW